MIDSVIFTNRSKGEDVLISPIPAIQFPILLVFAIIVSKTERLCLEFCRLGLRTDCFSHEQLGIASTTAGKPSNLYAVRRQWNNKKYRVPISIGKITLLATFR